MCPYKDQEVVNPDTVNEEMADSDSDMSNSEGEDSDKDSDSSDISVDADTQDDDDIEESSDSSDEHQVIPVQLPEELAELAEGREDNVDDDELVQAILRAKEKHSTHPPNITCDEGLSHVSFHPSTDILAVATYTGDALLYKYCIETTELLHTMEVHTKAIRGLDFKRDGTALLTCSKDRSISVSSVETGKLIQVYEKAHEDPLYSLYSISEHLFATGCESGFVKLWDFRRPQPVFSLRVDEDIVTAMITSEQKSVLVAACGGTLNSINIRGRRLQVQSEEYENDFTCLGLVRQESKLIAASSIGTMYVFNWGEFGTHTHEFTDTKQSVNCLVPISETAVVTGCDDGILRATHAFPHRHLGIVGQHSSSVESMDISHDGPYLASADGGNIVKFWNIKYFEELEIHFKKSNPKSKMDDLQNNLPSSGSRNPGEFFSDLTKSS